MASAAKALANHINAQASTGPRTQEGKATSRLNAVSHSLTSKTIVLPHESQEEYDAALQSLMNDHRPASENERLLVERLAQAHWRLQRCYNVERAFLENRIAAAQEESPDIDPDAAMAQLFVDKAEAGRMRLVMRYLGAAERAFYKAGADLAKAQAERRRREAEEAETEALAAVYKPVGFVSHTSTHPELEEHFEPGDDSEGALSGVTLSGFPATMPQPSVSLTNKA
jgi:hypothetical protein